MKDFCVTFTFPQNSMFAERHCYKRHFFRDLRRSLNSFVIHLFTEQIFRYFLFEIRKNLCADFFSCIFHYSLPPLIFSSSSKHSSNISASSSFSAVCPKAIT